MGGYHVIIGRLTLGELVAFLSLTSVMFPVATSITNAIINFPMINVSLERFYQIIDSVYIQNERNKKNVHLTFGNIELKNINFSYPSSCTPVLNNITLNIPSNKITLVTGASGCGKSTLLKLILGIYDSYYGQIEIDDYDIKTIKKKSLRRQISYIGTETNVFPGTIIDNITYGIDKKHLSIEKITNAIKLACLDEKISKLPNGLNTILNGEDDLSTGEKQRLTLARSFLYNPKIMLLDEVTANINGEMVEKILANLKHESINKTIVIVSHHEIVAKFADTIISLEKL